MTNEYEKEGDADNDVEDFSAERELCRMWDPVQITKSYIVFPLPCFTF